MAITSPALTVAMDVMFGNIKPVLDAVRKIGATDFSGEAPQYNVAPGATIKIPVSSVEAASAYNADSNNYLTGGSTDWAELTASHYLQGFDVSGVDVDNGVNAGRMRQLFTARAGAGIAAAVQNNIKTALDGLTAQSQVQLPIKSGETGSDPTIDNWLALADTVDWLDKSTSCLAVNGTGLASLKKCFAAAGIPCDLDNMAAMCGFASVVLVPGKTARATIIPAGAAGFLGRVPTIIARYMEAGTQVDPDTGLTVGIVLADDQAHNRVVANADLWFGTAIKSAAYSTTWTKGAIKIA